MRGSPPSPRPRDAAPRQPARAAAGRAPGALHAYRPLHDQRDVLPCRHYRMSPRRMRFLTLLLAFTIVAVEVRAQEPRLPAMAATPSESEALIQRARALSAAGNYRDSAAAWQV